ncbi:hypothetical protein, partial [Staphylococcus epidermidis]
IAMKKSIVIDFFIANLSMFTNFVANRYLYLKIHVLDNFDPIYHFKLKTTICFQTSISIFMIY